MKKIIYLSLILSINNAFAESVIYKCVNEKGKTTYINSEKNLPANCKKTDLSETANEKILNKKQESNTNKPQEVDNSKIIPKTENINLNAQAKPNENEYLGSIKKQMKDIIENINARNSERKEVLNQK